MYAQQRWFFKKILNTLKTTACNEKTLKYISTGFQDLHDFSSQNQGSAVSN